MIDIILLFFKRHVMTQWKQEILSGRRARFTPTTIREIGSIALIGFMAGLSYLVNLPLLLFPEFGALSNCVITRPQHIWARSPYHLAIMPALTGCIGVLAARLLGYGVLSVLLVLIPSLIILNFLRSPILPALSSGLIPLVLNIPSWTYPLSVFSSCSLLAIIVYFLGRRLKTPAQPEQSFRLFKGGWQRNSFHLFIFICFISAIAFIAQKIHQPILLFPPLAVLGFEIIFHTGKHPWRHFPVILSLIFFFCATGGLVAFSLCGRSVIGVVIAVSIAVCITFWRGLYVPTAIAVSLLPFVMPHVELIFPFEITFSVAMLLLVAVTRDWLTIKITRMRTG